MSSRRVERNPFATPVGSLTNSDSVDSFVDTGQTFTLVDILEYLEGGFDGGTDTGLLVSSDFDSLHACAETCRQLDSA
jgi:hypothetical protein